MRDKAILSFVYFSAFVSKFPIILINASVSEFTTSSFWGSWRVKSICCFWAVLLIRPYNSVKRWRRSTLVGFIIYWVESIFLKSSNWLIKSVNLSQFFSIINIFSLVSGLPSPELTTSSKGAEIKLNGVLISCAIVVKKSIFDLKAKFSCSVLNASSCFSCFALLFFM